MGNQHVFFDQSDMITKHSYILLNMLDAFEYTIIAHSHHFMHANISIYKKIIFSFTFIFDSIQMLLIAKIAWYMLHITVL